jgi:hypothetical protein
MVPSADALLLHEVQRQLYLVLLPLSEVDERHTGSEVSGRKLKFKSFLFLIFFLSSKVQSPTF